jgi:hypothetical protein
MEMLQVITKLCKSLNFKNPISKGLKPYLFCLLCILVFRIYKCNLKRLYLKLKNSKI